MSAAVGILAVVVILGVFRILPRHYQSVGVLDKSSASSMQFIGGGSWIGPWWFWGCTWPFVRLEIRSDGFRMGSSFWLARAIVPTSEVRWSDLKEVKEVRAGSSIRMRITGKGKEQTLFFSSFTRSMVHSAFEALQHD